MKGSSEELITLLTNQTSDVLKTLHTMEQLPTAQLNKRPKPEAWSALECLEHLNRYARFYHPEIDKRMKASTRPFRSTFRSTWLGEYFAQAVAPREKLNKMNALTNMNPSGSQVDAGVLEEFIRHQETLLTLLETARSKDIQKTKTDISISTLIRLRLGDTFRVLINHNVRHMQQAERALTS